MNIYFDFDGTLCPDSPDTPPRTAPDPEVAKLLRYLRRQGHRLTAYSCRGSATGGWRERHARREVESYLQWFDIPVDRIELARPRYDLLIDRKAVQFDGDWKRMIRELTGRVPEIRRSAVPHDEGAGR